MHLALEDVSWVVRGSYYSTEVESILVQAQDFWVVCPPLPQAEGLSICGKLFLNEVRCGFKMELIPELV